MASSKTTIAVYKYRGECIKTFPAEVWDDGDRAKVTMFVRGKKQVFEYKLKRMALRCCMNAIVKNWVPFDPAIHHVTIEAK